MNPSSSQNGDAPTVTTNADAPAVTNADAPTVTNGDAPTLTTNADAPAVTNADAPTVTNADAPTVTNGDAPTVTTNANAPTVTTNVLDGLPGGLPVTDAAKRGRHARELAANSPAAVRTPQERDYRLRGLATEPTGDVPPAPARMDHPRRRRRGPLLVKLAALLAVAAIAALALQAFVVQHTRSPGTRWHPPSWRATGFSR